MIEAGLANVCRSQTRLKLAQESDVSGSAPDILRPPKRRARFQGRMICNIERGLLAKFDKWWNVRL